MAILPKNAHLALISPIFCMMVGCSNTSKMTAPPSIPAPAPAPMVDYTQNPKWMAAQQAMNEALSDAQKLQIWAGKTAKFTATNLAKAKATRKGEISDCNLVFKLVDDKKADKIFGKYMDAFNIQVQMNPSSSEAGFQRIDAMIEDAKFSLATAAKNCKRQPK